jgi:hypothetical protein
MNWDLRTFGDLALAAALAIGATYAARDIRRKGWRLAIFEGSSTPGGSFEDHMGKAAGIGVAVFLLTRLTPSNPLGVN